MAYRTSPLPIDTNTVSIRLGDGLGGFSGTPNVPVGNGPLSVAVGDFNNDGKQDIATANAFSNTVSIRLGNGLGGFSGTTEVNVGPGVYPQFLAIGDFNNDRKQDIAVADHESGKVSILIGDGVGKFRVNAEINPGGGRPTSIAIGDFNNDGKQDLAVTQETESTSIAIRLGNGLGGFSGTTQVPIGAPDGSNSVAIGDFNGDGKQDLAAPDYTYNRVAIRLGDGLGGFSGMTYVSVGDYPASVAVGDFNNDGKQDLAVANNVSGTVSILPGDGLGGFGSRTDYNVNGFGYSIAVGDFDGDGKQDIAVAKQVSTTVSVLLGTCALPLQLSSALSRKTHGAAGTFDVDLPLTGGPGIECRDTNGNHTLVFTFTNAVVSGSATVTSAGGGSVSGSPTFAGKTMTVSLTNVTNAQQLTLNLSSVTDAFAEVLPDTTVDMVVLAGDTTGNKAVNSSDVAQTKQQSGAPVNGIVGAANFREDVVVDGSINSTDISSVKLRTGTSVP